MRAPRLHERAWRGGQVHGADVNHGQLCHRESNLLELGLGGGQQQRRARARPWLHSERQRPRLQVIAGKSGGRRGGGHGACAATGSGAMAARGNRQGVRGEVAEESERNRSAEESREEDRGESGKR